MYVPALLLPPADDPGRHVPAVPGGGRGSAGTDAGRVVHDAGGARPGRPHRHAHGEEGAGGRAGVPPGQPPARLPGVRQGRRVPAPGPGLQPRPGREPLRRGEAPLREADPDQLARLPRSRALHPVRPLHPLRGRGGRRPADLLHPPGQQHPGPHLPGRAVRLLLQRQHGADLPGGRADGQALPVQGPAVGPGADGEHLHDVLGRVPDHGPVQPEPACCATRASTATR